jgi:hypothetical protein
MIGPQIGAILIYPYILRHSAAQIELMEKISSQSGNGNESRRRFIKMAQTGVHDAAQLSPLAITQLGIR